MTKPKNEEAFIYIARWGTIFKGRCDFSAGIKVENKAESIQNYSSDLVEMITYHRANIWEDLNGFRGYDAISFNFY